MLGRSAGRWAVHSKAAGRDLVCSLNMYMYFKTAIDYNRNVMYNVMYMTYVVQKTLMM
jgi:hypothetical protein